LVAARFTNRNRVCTIGSAADGDRCRTTRGGCIAERYGVAGVAIANGAIPRIGARPDGDAIGADCLGRRASACERGVPTNRDATGSAARRAASRRILGVTEGRDERSHPDRDQENADRSRAQGAHTQALAIQAKDPMGQAQGR